MPEPTEISRRTFPAGSAYCHATGSAGQLMHLVEHVLKVLLRIDADSFDTGQDLADDFLPGGGVREPSSAAP